MRSACLRTVFVFALLHGLLCAPLPADEIADFQSAFQANTIEAYEAYLRKYPDGAYVDEARRMIEKLRSARRHKEETTVSDNLLNESIEQLAARYKRGTASQRGEIREILESRIRKSLVFEVELNRNYTSFYVPEKYKLEIERHLLFDDELVIKKEGGYRASRVESIYYLCLVKNPSPLDIRVSYKLDMEPLLSWFPTKTLYLQQTVQAHKDGAKGGYFRVPSSIVNDVTNDYKVVGVSVEIID